VVPTIIFGVIGQLLFGGVPVVFSAFWRMRTLPTEMVAASGVPAASDFEPGAEPEGSRPTEPLN
jgi:hypothetical protein